MKRICILTQRELDVLILIAQGKSNKEIAQTLGLAVKTVEHHAVKSSRG